VACAVRSTTSSSYARPSTTRRRRHDHREQVRPGAESMAPSSPRSRPRPPGWPAASLDPGCGRRRQHRSGGELKEDQQSKIHLTKVSTESGDCQHRNNRRSGDHAAVKSAARALTDWNRWASASEPSICADVSLRAGCADIPAFSMSSGGRDPMGSGGCLVVEGPGLEAAMQYADQAVADLAQGCFASDVACAQRVVVRPSTW